MKEEELLYNVIFPKDEDPNYINYGYFIGKSKRSIDKLKATIDEGPLNPILICDGNKENAFFAKVFQSEVDRFLKIITEFNFEQIKINSHFLKEIKYMFGEEVINHRKKMYNASQYLYLHKFKSGITNMHSPILVSLDPINENQPTLKRAI
ncbi:hypothetical protein G9F72_011940 [Clostridium estertheticum]|uniref:hypothetical protein n=1 Tax=Clostridium estertheticum TaxID=238834 RepID=UPI0013E958D5|nr:hypothetical protein [Clostridium estertheticum]MBZ9687034.1 hypothetical protein [Clostridium estertheticum]